MRFQPRLACRHMVNNRWTGSPLAILVAAVGGKDRDVNPAELPGVVRARSRRTHRSPPERRIVAGT
jgi:hypothetical protein